MTDAISKDDFNHLVELYNRRLNSDVIGVPYEEQVALGRAIEQLRAAHSERERCIALCEVWIGTFQDRAIKYTTPREYAIGAIEDIIDLIRNGQSIGDAVSSPLNSGE
ncbi:MAG: hypothetical protein JWR80_10011 [Bradyrhizobium sp.]|nr:hypothetical protein [Bradyrhizobium sp.]